MDYKVENPPPPPLAFRDGETLCCPECGEENGLHHSRVDVYTRPGKIVRDDVGPCEPEDTPPQCVTVTVDGSVRITQNARTNPSSRRHGLRIFLWCELCGKSSSIGIAQHKGQTIVSVESIKLVASAQDIIHRALTLMPISTANEPSTAPRWKPRPKPPAYPGDLEPLPPDPNFLRTIDPVMQAALDPLDRLAAFLEATWGCGRLQTLVSPETAARFASAQRKLDAAIRAKDTPLATSRASVLKRGWEALDVEARALGHSPGSIDVWCVPHAPTGKWYAIVRHAKDADKARQLHPDHTVIALADLVASHLVTFRAQQYATEPLPDDEIPW